MWWNAGGGKAGAGAVPAPPSAPAAGSASGAPPAHAPANAAASAHAGRRLTSPFLPSVPIGIIHLRNNRRMSSFIVDLLR